jgi:hypothetical protein
MIQDIYALNYGGGFYIDHDLLDVNIIDHPINVRTSKAGLKGGFFYILNAKAINLAKLTFKDLVAQDSGTFLHSTAIGLQLKVTDSFIYCQDPAPIWTTLSVPLSPPFPGLSGGAFHIEGATTMTEVTDLTLE